MWPVATLESAFDGVSPQYVLNFLIVRANAIWVAIGLFLITVIFSVYQGVKPHRGALVAAIASVLYVCGLYVAYLGTPLDLTFHLFTSATRTMATASVSLFISMFFLLSSLEAHAGTR